MDKKNFAFQKENYLICTISFVIILLGFFLMTGSATTIDGGFEPDIFSTRRIVIAPMTSFFGFLLMIVGILYRSKKNEGLEDELKKTRE